MRLYGYWRSSASWRVRIALHYKGLPYEYVPVHLLEGGGQQHAESYRALNPMRQVPALELVDEQGQVHHLTQSLAILEYLEERYPSPPLLPAEPLARARARALAELVNSGIQPLQNLAVLQRVQSEYQADSKAWAAPWVQRGLEAFQAALAGSPGPYCLGTQPTFADVCLVPQLYGARRFGVDLTPFARLTQIEAACNLLPAFQAAHPDRQPDAVPA